MAHRPRRMPEKATNMELQTTTIEGVTYAVVQDGKPVYVDAGKTIAFDAVGTRDTIGRLNGEAKGHRERAEKAETALKVFEGLDPEQARKALETVTGLDQKKLIDAGQVETVKAEITKAYQEKLDAAEARAKGLESTLHNEMIGGAFARSKTIADKFAIPADLVQARFGGNFKLEDGRVVAYDQTGNKLYSKASPGNAADFDEALELLVDAYPYRDSILKGEIRPGGGAQQTGGTGGPKTIKRDAFMALAPAEQAARVKDGFAIAD
jgi:hypothetical protein